MRSQGFGVGDARASTDTGSGRLTGGTLGPRTFTSRATTWGDAPRTPERDRLVVIADNVASLVVDARRAPRDVRRGHHDPSVRRRRTPRAPGELPAPR